MNKQQLISYKQHAYWRFVLNDACNGLMSPQLNMFI